MDDLSPLGLAYRGKRVLITGHTGFKGSWLSLWLSRLGASILGYATAPPTSPAMFDLCGVRELLDHRVADIRDRATLDAAVKEFAPDVIFHLAAQPLVLASYADPLETVEVNITGTANVLEAARKAGRRMAIVAVTSDKCYANREWPWGYRENDPMGGADPYSMSKGAAELLIDSWRRSYFSRPDSPIRLASGRAGNVIGGGDWAEGRILTDCVAAFAGNRKVTLRNPLATRPWQHVLEPLSGYLWLGAKLMEKGGDRYAEGWNFGPNLDAVCTVQTLVEKLAQKWPGQGWALAEDADPPHEAMALSLAIEKAQHRLRWRPVWTIDQCLDRTVEWYKAWAEGSHDLRTLSVGQIDAFERDARYWR